MTSLNEVQTDTGPSEDEVVAGVLIGEAGGEGLTGMRAVLEVIDTRARRGKKTRYEVVTKRLQFSCLNGVDHTDFVEKHRKHRRWPDAMTILSETASGRMTNGADHYHATWMKTKPFWAKGKEPVAIIGKHAFYRLY